MRDTTVTSAAWRKSSYSSGASNCVEVATTRAWRKSSYSQGAANCVEVAVGPGVAVRDSKNPTGLALVVPAGAWRRFVASLRRA